jgi:glyoxylase-like metal-dependent hydrolase (beta-lactamase superfamily II)
MKALPLPLLASALALVSTTTFPLHAEVNKTEQIAPGVYFHEGDLGRNGHCNNGWIIFDDFVLVIDGNFPSGAQEVIPKIKTTTDKPIRFTFDTHHHGDHAYGNQIWFENGATPVAHVGVLEEMKKYETGYFGSKPGRWEEAAKERKDVAASKLKPPTLLFDGEMIFEDGKHRVELRHFGIAHTHGDGFAWSPKERILFTGDACVNGPYNFMGDGDTGEWVKTLSAARKLQPKIICPGHGPMGGPELLDNQIAFITELRKEVKKLVDAGMKPEEVKAAASLIKESLRKNDKIAIYIGSSLDAHVEKVYTEMGGQPFPKKETATVETEQSHSQELAARR